MQFETHPDRSKERIHCDQLADWSTVWSVSLKNTLGTDHMGVGQFSGGGRLFGAEVAACDHNYMIVLDARTGKQVNRLVVTCEGLPYRERFIRSNATYLDTFDAETLDLETGQTGPVTLTK